MIAPFSISSLKSTGETIQKNSNFLQKRNIRRNIRIVKLLLCPETRLSENFIADDFSAIYISRK